MNKPCEYGNCPNCNIKIGLMGIDDKEQPTYICPNTHCGLVFKVLSCPHCNQLIYIDKNTRNFKFEYCNLECPHCDKIFFLSQCPNCLVRNKIPNRVNPTSKFLCQNCRLEYYRIKCPIKDCELYHGIENDQIEKESNFPGGIKMKHYRKIIKIINCPQCQEMIYFISPEIYTEGQQIICTKCKYSFHRLICPECKKINILKHFEFGEKIMCSNPDCLKCFTKVVCPYCMGNNCFVKLNQYGGYNVKCKAQGCNGQFTMMNCSYCKRLNIIHGKHIRPGETIQCGYEDCNSFINKVTCPSCKRFNIYDSPFPLGKTVKCQFQNCSKSFKAFMCPYCKVFKFSKKQTPFGIQLTCQICHCFFVNLNCPFCKMNIIDHKSSLNEMQLTQCPSCKKNFSATICVNCKNPIYSQENELIENKPLVCNEDNCRHKLVCVSCPSPTCKCVIAFHGRIKAFEEGEKCKCNSCNLEFEPYETSQKNKELGIYTRLKVIPPYKAYKCLFGKERKSENNYNFKDLVIGLKKEKEILNEDMNEIKMDSSPNLFNTDISNISCSNDSLKEVEMQDSKGKSISTQSSNRFKFSMNNSNSTASRSFASSYLSDNNSSDNSSMAPSIDLGEIIMKEDKIKNLCPICQHGLKEAVFIPCGHRCVCYQCAENINSTTKLCYKCHNKIEKVVKKVFNA
ncbi:MAG: RING-HC finger protein [archaeon]|nr:RING-HC finger protein [archaeon]